MQGDGSMSTCFFYCEASWLSRGKVLERLWELKEVKASLMKNNSDLVNLFHDELWLGRLAYLRMPSEVSQLAWAY